MGDNPLFVIPFQIPAMQYKYGSFQDHTLIIRWSGLTDIPFKTMTVPCHIQESLIEFIAWLPSYTH